MSIYNGDGSKKTFGQWTAEHVRDLRCPANVAQVRARAEFTRLIEETFAAMFDGDADKTAQRVAETLDCDLYDVEQSGAFEAAVNGDSAEEIRKIFG